MDLPFRPRGEFFSPSPKRRRGKTESHKVSYSKLTSRNVPRAKQKVPFTASSSTSGLQNGCRRPRWLGNCPSIPGGVSPALGAASATRAPSLRLSLVGGGKASLDALTSGQGARGLIRPSSAAGAPSSEMAGKFPGKVDRGEGAGRFGKECRGRGDSARLELSGSQPGFQKACFSPRARGTRSAASCESRFAPPPPAARGSAPSANNLTPGERPRGWGKASRFGFVRCQML